MQPALPFVGHSESGKCAPKASGTLGEYKVIEHCLPTPNAILCASITCTSLYIIMLSTSSTSGTLSLSWRRWIYLQGKLSTMDRCFRNTPMWVKNFGTCLCHDSPVALTICTKSTGPDHCRCCYPVLLRHGHLALHLGPLDPDYKGGGDCSQQVPTSSQPTPWLYDQVPTDPPGLAWPIEAMFYHEEAQDLLSDTELPCP